MNYCNGVHDLINYTLYNLRNISGEGITCPCKRCKNKKFLYLDVVTMHLLQKWFMKKYLCWYAYIIYSSRYYSRKDDWVNF